MGQAHKEPHKVRFEPQVGAALFGAPMRYARNLIFDLCPNFAHILASRREQKEMQCGPLIA